MNLPDCARYSQFAVRAVAEWRFGGMLAATEKDGLVFGGLDFDWRESASLMRSVAEGLRLAFAAGTPEIGFARRHIDLIRRFLGNMRVAHDIFPCSIVGCRP